jgi:hypothetical protein
MARYHCPGKWRFLSEFYGTRRYWVRNIGSVSVAYIEPRTANNPSDRPWHLVCWGLTFDTPEAALNHAIKTWESPGGPRDNSYARLEGSMLGPLGRFEEP